MHIIVSNYSNNSLALIQWAHEARLQNVTVCYIDTGWGAAGWEQHIEQSEHFVRSKGFTTLRLTPRAGFDDLMVIMQGFPSQKHQWCGLHLKGITLLQWLDEIDPDAKAVLLLAKRSAEQSRALPEYIEQSEYHGSRKVWHPLYRHSVEERDALLAQAGITPLNHRSYECQPCINSTVSDLRNLSEQDIDKTEELEEELGVYMFQPEYCQGAQGIRAVVQWARECAADDVLNLQYGCSADFGCGD